MAGNDSDFSTSRSSRFLKLGKLTSTVGSSYLGQAVKSTFQGAEDKARSLLAVNTKNALRVARTFGELKGAVMKVGQMLSLQADLFPPEVRDILNRLQSHAPPVPFSQVEPLLREELGSKVDELCDHISDTAYASASIGQVHRAVLRDGREVVIKIQYPRVAEMVDSDLKNLRIFLRSIRQITPVKADVERLFEEARARLVEELDYRLELMNMLEFRELFKDDDRFIIPKPVEALSSRRVLTSEFQPGLDADELLQDCVPQQRRDLAGTYLLDAILIQFFGFRVLQADPNLANFAFTEDNRIILYDFGCVKRFPSAFVEGIRRLARDAWLGRYERLRTDAEALGYVDKGKDQLPIDVFKSYADTICDQWRAPGVYDFGSSTIMQQLLALHGQYWQKAFDYDAPADAVYMHRVYGGMLGNLRRLKARIPIYDLIVKHIGPDEK